MPPRSSRMSVVQTKVAIGLLLSAVALVYPTAAVASDDSFQKADMVVPETSLVEEPAPLSKMDATKIYLKSSGYNDAQIADWESDVNAKATADAKAAAQAEADAREAIELAQAETVHERN